MLRVFLLNPTDGVIERTAVFYPGIKSENFPVHLLNLTDGDMVLVAETKHTFRLKPRQDGGPPPQHIDSWIGPSIALALVSQHRGHSANEIDR